MMKNDFDASFDPRRHFTGVPMETGEVSRDADWNASGAPEVQQANARIPPPHGTGPEETVLEDAVVSNADTPAVLRDVLSILHPPDPSPERRNAPVDKFVSETEENLQRIFDAAENLDLTLPAADDDDLFSRRSTDDSDD